MAVATYSISIWLRYEVKYNMLLKAAILLPWEHSDLSLVRGQLVLPGSVHCVCRDPGVVVCGTITDTTTVWRDPGMCKDSYIDRSMPCIS